MSESVSIGQLDDLLAELDMDGGDMGGGPLGGGAPPQQQPPSDLDNDLDALLDGLGMDDGPPAGVSSGPGRVSSGPGRVSSGPGRVSSGPGRGRGISSGPGGRGRGFVSSGPGGRVSSGPGRGGMMSSGPGRGGMSSGPGRGGMMSSGPGARHTSGIDTQGALQARGVVSSGPGLNRPRVGPGRARPMATHTPDGREVQHHGPTCADCDEMIIGKVLNVNGAPYHVECFTCSECNRALRGQKFITKDDELFCADCFYELFAPRCRNCQGVIRDKCISAGEHKFHPQHFLCTGCGTRLTGQNRYKLDLDGDPFCTTCFGKRRKWHEAPEHTCAQCKKPIVGEYLLIRGQYVHPEHYECEVCHKAFVGGDCREWEGKLYCNEDYLKMLKNVCAACRKPITGRSLSALNRVWHPEHFVCAHCHDPFGESGFWENEGLPYCETHYFSLFGSRCAKCSKPVVTNGINAMGKVWHKEHFCCTGCEEPIKKKMWAWEDKPYCRRCFNKLPTDVKQQVKKRSVGQAKAKKRAAQEAKSAAKKGQ